MRHTIDEGGRAIRFVPAIALAFLQLFPLLLLPASAAEEPEAVYASYHRAAASGNLDEMLRYAPAAKRAEISAMSASQRDAMVKMLAISMPRAYTLKQKQVAPNGANARLLLDGPSGEIIDGKAEMLYGVIRMVNERGEWKVNQSDWGNEPRGTAPAASAPAKPAAAKPAAKGGTLVGSDFNAPVRKLGTAKEPCVYKPVMTAEDIANCK